MTFEKAVKGREKPHNISKNPRKSPISLDSFYRMDRMHISAEVATFLFIRFWKLRLVAKGKIGVAHTE